MVLQNLQPRFTRHLVGIPFQDLKSLVHVAFSVKEVIARGLWTDTAGSSSRFGEVGIISYHHSPYRPPTVRAHFSHPQYQYQPVYVQ